MRTSPGSLKPKFHSRRLSRVLLATAVLSLAAAASARAAVPPVLQQMPDDARVVLVVANVKDLGNKISNIAVRLNLPAPPDLAGYLTRMVKITKGFDAAGSAGLVMLAEPAAAPDKEAPDHAGPPPLVALLPTTDPAAMMEGFQPGAPDKAGISEVNLPNDQAQKGYIATLGKAPGPQWVALATDRPALESFLAKKGSLQNALPPESLKVFEHNDLVVWANIPTLTKGVDKKLEDAEQDLTGRLDLMNLNNAQDPLLSGLQKAAINEYFLAIKEYLSDATSEMLTLRLSDAGASIGLVSAFKPESPFGKFVAAQKPATPISLQGLPGGDFLLAGAVAIDPTSVSNIIGDVGHRVLSDETIAKSPQAKDFATIVEQYQAAVKLVTGTRFVMLEPAAGASEKTGFFNGAYLVDTAEPEKLLAIQQEILKNPLLHHSMIADIKQDLTQTPDAVTIKGVKLSKMQIKYTLRDDAAGDKPVSELAKQQFKMLQKMYGTDGMTMYTGVVGKHVLLIMGSGAAILEGSVAAAQSDGKDLSNSALITGAKDQVVADPTVVIYASLARFVGLIMSAAMPGAPAAPPAGSAPAVFSEGVNGSTSTAELHIPTTTIAAIKDMVQGMMMHGMGGAGGGGMP